MIMIDASWPRSVVFKFGSAQLKNAE